MASKIEFRRIFAPKDGEKMKEKTIHPNGIEPMKTG